MFKKALYFAGSLCILAALASCGNNKQNEENANGTDTTIVGEVVTEVAQQGDTIVAATAEAVDTITNATKDAANSVANTAKEATVPADKGAN